MNGLNISTKTEQKPSDANLNIHIEGTNWTNMIPSEEQIFEWTEKLTSILTNNPDEAITINITNTSHKDMSFNIYPKNLRSISERNHFQNYDLSLASNILLNEKLRKYIIENTIPIPIRTKRLKVTNTEDGFKTYPIIIQIQKKQDHFPVKITPEGICNSLRKTYNLKEISYNPFKICIKAYGIPKENNLSMLIFEKFLKDSIFDRFLEKWTFV